MAKCCATCRHIELPKPNDAGGRCRRWPPVAFLVPHPISGQPSATMLFPSVAAADIGCGEYSGAGYQPGIALKIP